MSILTWIDEFLPSSVGHYISNDKFKYHSPEVFIGFKNLFIEGLNENNLMEHNVSIGKFFETDVLYDNELGFNGDIIYIDAQLKAYDFLIEMSKNKIKNNSVIVNIGG